MDVFLEEWIYIYRQIRYSEQIRQHIYTKILAMCMDGWMDRERDRGVEIDEQIGRQINRQTAGRTDRQIRLDQIRPDQTHRQIDRQICKQADRDRQRETEAGGSLAASLRVVTCVATQLRSSVQCMNLPISTIYYSDNKLCVTTNKTQVFVWVDQFDQIIIGLVVHVCTYRKPFAARSKIA